MGKPFFVTRIFCQYGRGKRREHQAICAASGENGTNARTADGIVSRNWKVIIAPLQAEGSP